MDVHRENDIKMTMERGRLMRSIFFALPLLLTACTTSYKLAGKFDNFNEVFVGDLNHDVFAGVAKITAQTERSGIVCNGGSKVKYIPPFSFNCRGQKGTASLRCTDGRNIEAEWTAHSCSTGYGQGADQEGNRFSFVFGLTEEEARRELSEYRPAVAANPDLPAYEPKKIRAEKGYATGTAFAVAYGWFVSNHHVVDGAAEIEILSASGSRIPATLVVSDQANDVAILRASIGAPGLPIGDSSRVLRGEEVLTLGYPLIQIQGQLQKATFGRINSLAGIQDDPRFLQMDVPIQPGNSGGPLMNKNGEVIGIVTATLDQLVTLKLSGSLPQNVNYALKSDYLVPLLKQHVPNWLASVNTVTSSDLSVVVEKAESSVFLLIAR